MKISSNEDHDLFISLRLFNKKLRNNEIINKSAKMDTKIGAIMYAICFSPALDCNEPIILCKT